MGHVRAYVVRSWDAARHRLIIAQDNLTTIGPRDHKIKIASDFVWTEREEGDLFDPSEGIGRADDLIQAVMDSAWEAGFRPRGFSDVKNETSALREHLADLKAIAFHQLKIKSTG